MIFIKQMKNTILFLPFIAFLMLKSGGVSAETHVDKELAQNTTCELCHVLVNAIDHELELGNKTITDITNIVDDICHIIGGPSGKECSFIVENIREIVKYLTEGLNSTQVCIKLKLCNETIIHKNFNSHPLKA